jgi:hypothetical protein
MPLFDKFSRKERYRKQEEKIKVQQEQLIRDGRLQKKEAEHRERLNAYELQRKEKELAEEKVKLERKLELARQKAAEREEEKRRGNAALQAALAREKAEELEQTKRSYDNEIRRLEEARFRNDHEAQVRLAEEKKQREEVMQQLRKEREDREKARRSEEARQQRVKEKKEAERREIELQKEKEEKMLLQAEKKRQQDQLLNHNTTRALQELRDLIRERYELDMQIYRLRNRTAANRDVVIKLMVKSDEILQKIRSIVEIWNPASFDETEWPYAEQVKERLLADGKRIWATDLPWPTDEKGGRPAPRRGRPSPRGGGRPSPRGEGRVPSGSRNQL